jgi:hypothetical protein
LTSSTTWLTRWYFIVVSWDYLVDACATNVSDTASVVDVCNRFSVAHSFPSGLSVLRLSSRDSHTLLNSRYSGPTVAMICPCTSSIGVSSNPQGRSSVFMSENNFSTTTTYQ